MDELRALRSRGPATATVGPAASWSEASVILQRNAEMKMLQTRIEWLQDARKVMQGMLARGVGQPPG